MKELKQQNFLRGAGIMGLSLIIVKLLGAFYKIPLNNLIGSEGYTYFLHAFDIYSLLLVISTAGLPVAMSRMVADAGARNNTAQIRMINRAALILFTILGVAGTLLMTAGAKGLAALMGIPDGVPVMVALGPSVLFVCLCSAFRGYFQGQSIMTPSGISQIIEAVCKLVPGLPLAWIIQKQTGNLIYSVAGAILGVTIGEVAAYAYLYIVYRRHSSRLGEGDPAQKASSLKDTLKELLAIGVPISLGSAGLQLFGLVDDAMIMQRLQNAAGLTYLAAKEVRGLYGTAQTIFNLPGALMTAFTATALPAISACLAKEDRKGALEVANSEIRIMTLIILPCAVGMGVLGEPIIRLLYSAYNAEECAVAGELLTLSAVAIILNGLVLMINTILQAHGHVYTPVINMLIGGVVKIAVNFVLVGIPSINIYGAPIGTVICFAVITVLDILSMRRRLPDAPEILKLMGKNILVCAVMGAGAYGCYALLSRFVGVKAACAGAICFAVAIYAVGIFAAKLLTYEDCLLMPKGDKIAALLHVKKSQQEILE